MTALNLIGRGKINQHATLLLFQKIEELRAVPLEQLNAGEFETPSGTFTINWRIEDHVPYLGTKQIRCRILYNPTQAVVVESLFYRSE